MTIGLDYETFSYTNLPVNGLDNYVKDPGFRTLLASVALSDDPADQWTYDFVFNCVRMHETSGDEVVNGFSVADEFRAWLNGSITSDHDLVAHNAGFERAVSDWLDPGFPAGMFVDSAVAARAMGASEKLMFASRQLTNSHKLEEGPALVMLFCVPNDIYPDGPTPELIEKNGHMDKWLLFVKYCEMDAAGCKEIYDKWIEFGQGFDPKLVVREEMYELETHEMNQNGWFIDVPLVEKMKQRAWANGIIAQRVFVTDTGAQINFNSHPQLKAFCEKRGVPIKSLDKYHLPVLLRKVKERIASGKYNEETVEGYREVQALLETKQEMGGSTLSKLPKFLELVGPDGRLRNQYVHVGAGQTYRTASKGVQLQNLAKLNGDIRDVSTLYDFKEPWSNTDMVGQLRQVMEAEFDEDEIIVGDFSAVESRTLAYLAGEEWKLDAYREGLDVYKVLVTKYLNIAYEEVTKEQRPRGKYTELSAGYQASAQALKDFMFKLGFVITLEAAAQDIRDWRKANPKIEKFWETLDVILKDAVYAKTKTWAKIGHGLTVTCTPFTLESMEEQHPGSVSLVIQILRQNGEPIVTRVVHGLYFRGDKLCYYKPTDKFTGPLWVAKYRNPKWKPGQPKELYYSIYGGKLAGILTQSLARELFFESLVEMSHELAAYSNVRIVGQFHDEVNVEWTSKPDVKVAATKEQVIEIMERTMSTCSLPDFPLIADVKSAHRYIK